MSPRTAKRTTPQPPPMQAQAEEAVAVAAQPPSLCEDCAGLPEPAAQLAPEFGQPGEAAVGAAAAEDDPPASRKGWEFLEAHGWPKYWAGPMVRGSELTWRLQVRKYGIRLASSPMIVAAGYARSPYYRSMFQFMPSEDTSDRPLVIQIAGTNPQWMLQAALLLEPLCDAIEVNMGCPKGCAQKQGFGAYLMTRTDLCMEIVSTLAKNLRVPVFVKTRIFSSWERTANLALSVQKAGAALLTVHPRTREQDRAGSADWGEVAKIVKLLQIPVVCNGDIRSKELAEKCLALTGSPTVMVARALLSNPAMFDEEVYLRPRREIRERFETDLRLLEESQPQAQPEPTPEPEEPQSQQQSESQQKSQPESQQQPESESNAVSDSESQPEPERKQQWPALLPERMALHHRMEQELSDFNWKLALRLAREYLELCMECPPHKSYISKHLHSILGSRLNLYPHQHNRLMVFDRMPRDKLRIEIYGPSCVLDGPVAAGNGVGFEEDPEMMVPSPEGADSVSESASSAASQEPAAEPPAKATRRPRPPPTPMDATPRELAVLMEMVEQLERMPAPVRPDLFSPYRVVGAEDEPPSPGAEPQQQEQQQQPITICRYFARGHCRDGDACAMLHTEDLDVGECRHVTEE